MKNLKTLFKKEFLFYFNNPLGYIAAVLFASFANFLFVKDLFIRGEGSMRPFFDTVPWLLLIFIPAICMRFFADERKTGTIEILRTLPISVEEIVVSKFLAGFAFVVIACALTLSIPLALSTISSLSWGEIVISYGGVLGIGAVFVAISLFFSSITKHQIVAFLASVMTIFFLLVLGSDFLSSFIPQSIHSLVITVSPSLHFGTFLKGLFDIRALVYVITTVSLCIYLTVYVLQTEK